MATESNAPTKSFKEKTVSAMLPIPEEITKRFADPVGYWLQNCRRPEVVRACSRACPEIRNLHQFPFALGRFVGDDAGRIEPRRVPNTHGWRFSANDGRQEI